MTNIRISTLAMLLTLAGGVSAGGGVYPPETSFDAAAGKTRQQVIAELREAQHLGLVPYADGNMPSSTASQERMIADAGLRAIGHSSVLVAQDSEPSGDGITVWGDASLMRVKVAAEAREALRLGLISVGEENPPVATEAQELQIAAAGRRAVDSARSSGQVAVNVAR